MSCFTQFHSVSTSVNASQLSCITLHYLIADNYGISNGMVWVGYIFEYLWLDKLSLATVKTKAEKRPSEVEAQ